MIKCPECGEKFARKPYKNKDGSWNWKNIWIPDPEIVLICLTILLLMFSYDFETKKCDDLFNDTCGFCERTNCFEQKIQPDYNLGITVNGEIANFTYEPG